MKKEANKKPKEVRITHDFVLIKPVTPPEKSESGIVIVEGGPSKVAPRMCMVIKTGPGVFDKFNNFIKPPCEPGDIVMVAQGNAMEVTLFDEKFMIVPSSEVLVVIR